MNCFSATTIYFWQFSTGTPCRNLKPKYVWKVLRFFYKFCIYSLFVYNLQKIFQLFKLMLALPIRIQICIVLKEALIFTTKNDIMRSWVTLFHGKIVFYINVLSIVHHNPTVFSQKFCQINVLPITKEQYCKLIWRNKHCTAATVFWQKSRQINVILIT